MNYVILTYFLVLSASATAESDVLKLLKPPLNEIQFEGVAPTQYSLSQGNLVAKVNSSASAVIVAFDKVKAITSVEIKWHLIRGKINTKDAASEEKKDGDDFPLRIGLLHNGPSPLIPFFAPAWIKKIAHFLIHPTDQMTYLVLGSQHPLFATWDSPYSSSIKQISLGKAATAIFSGNFNLSGIWIMADGDNTKSQFEISLERVSLKN